VSRAEMVGMAMRAYAHALAVQMDESGSPDSVTLHVARHGDEPTFVDVVCWSGSEPVYKYTEFLGVKDDDR